MSITIQAAIATIILSLAQAANISLNLTEDQLAKLILALLTVITGAIAWYGRYRKGDVTLFGKRKDFDVTIESLPHGPAHELLPEDEDDL